MFRIAAILQGIAKRVEAGTASSAQAKASGDTARPMAELAWSFAQRADPPHTTTRPTIKENHGL
jgi:hypothetical protein